MIKQLNSGWLKLWLCLLMLFGALQAYALQPIPPLNSPVTDLTQTLSSQEQAALASKLSQFAKEKGSQVAVIIVPTVSPEDIAQYANRVAMNWGLGRKKEQDGVLLVIAKNDRKVRIEVDSGLQGAIPDAYARRILDEQIRPRFKHDDYYGGLNAGLDQITDLINGEDLPPPAKGIGGNTIFELLPLIMFVAIISGTILRSIFGTFLGSAFNGGLVGGIAFMLGAVLATAGFAAFIAFIFTLMMGGRGLNGYGSYPGNYRGGGFGNGGFGGGFGHGGDIFTGGGSSGWSGGGASGSW